MFLRTLPFVACVSAIAGPLAAAERAPVTTERGTCIPGAHEVGRTIRLPGVAASSDRHREAHEDAYVHCTEARTERRAERPRKGSGR